MEGTPTEGKPLTPAAVRRNRVQMQRLRAQTLQIAEDLKCGLMSADRDVKVAKLIDHMIEKGAKLKEIKGSDAIAAAKLYADRRWPARQDSAPPARVYVHIDMREFRTDPADGAQDVTPTTTPCGSAGGKNTTEEILNEFNAVNVQ